MVLIDVPNICSLLKIDTPNSNLSGYFVLLKIFTVALQLNLQYLFLMLKVVGEFYDFLLQFDKAIVSTPTLYLQLAKSIENHCFSTSNFAALIENEIHLNASCCLYMQNGKDKKNSQYNPMHQLIGCNFIIYFIINLPIT